MDPSLLVDLVDPLDLVDPMDLELQQNLVGLVDPSLLVDLVGLLIPEDRLDLGHLKGQSLLVFH